MPIKDPDERAMIVTSAALPQCNRFPADFAFLLSSTEWEAVKAEIVASSGGRASYRRFLPYAFTEHGALTACLLNSPRAIEVSIYIARASVIWKDD